ncbi:MAG: hypothetical protein ACXW27_01330 [Allosphingosinicella sp.]
MQIQELDGGQVSLEMRPDEAGAVLARLQRGNGFARSKGVTHDLLSKDSISLIFMDEWDEPCLLSMDAAGASLLRSLAEDDGSRRSTGIGARG